MNLADQLRRMGFKPDQIATATVNGKPLCESEPKKASDGWPGFRSKWEAMYAAELDAQKAAGEIVDWQWEPVRWKLADAIVVDGKKHSARWYKIDFVAWLPNGGMRCIEVKGYKWRHAVNDYRAAKDRYRRVEFVMVTRTKTGWQTIL